MIPVLPGDGIGPIVMREALNVLRAVGIDTFLELPFGHACWRVTGESLPAATLAAVRQAGVALLGAATTDGCPSPILQLRRALDLDLMVRPAAGMVLVGHAFEGLYFAPEEEQPRWVVTPEGARRLLDASFARATRSVTLVDKPTVLRRHADIFAAAARPPPGIRFEIVNADAFVADVLRHRDRYDVVAATSFIADVLSDLFAALDGGIGRAPSASLGPNVAVFEPVHGSAPRRAAESPPRVDPTGAILAAAMLLEHIGEPARAARIRMAVAAVGRHDGRQPTAEWGAAVVGRL
jgi:isocitrate/isopropylmalate dehydrogenase